MLEFVHTCPPNDSHLNTSLNSYPFGHFLNSGKITHFRCSIITLGEDLVKIHCRTPMTKQVLPVNNCPVQVPNHNPNPTNKCHLTVICRSIPFTDWSAAGLTLPSLARCIGCGSHLKTFREKSLRFWGPPAQMD